tara:strand:+ start:16297 stop:16494 length:198 start_codon:yes stop_codon:yes gene_type:complete
MTTAQSAPTDSFVRSSRGCDAAADDDATRRDEAERAESRDDDGVTWARVRVRARVPGARARESCA